ncbi:hypothetical protein HU200_020719 [Digitaria exilis]|uniref:RING-type E3 ubiquitin transferase n=1 Tax=Digitaria exilis TaxID=1010633 RepID=A0A835F0V3_9POAL|nr:hypothetical protein HU200_020719 [Digitaria exilis]
MPLYALVLRDTLLGVSLFFTVYCFVPPIFELLPCFILLNRSHKEKRSSYAPESGVRYDGVYRIEKCWRKIGIQGKFKVCRYLFVRCDNEPAPWTSDDHGDRPRPLPKIKELQGATDITERKGRPSWDYVVCTSVSSSNVAAMCYERHIFIVIGERRLEMGCASASQQEACSLWDPETDKQIRRVTKRAHMSVAERLLKEFGCSICRSVIKEPLTTPCAHNFCKTCLLGAYDSQSSMRERSRGGRTLRAQKIVKTCPSCPTDICDFLENPQINREMMELIESLQRKAVEEGDNKVTSDDAEECGDGESEENDAALVNEEDDNSLNEEEEDNADGSLKIVVDIEEEKDDKKTKMGVTEVVDVIVEENAVKETKKRKGAETGTDVSTAKRMKNMAATEEGTRTPVKKIRKSDVDEGNGSPVVSSGRRVTRSSANASEADDSPARRTRSRARA